MKNLTLEKAVSLHRELWLKIEEGILKGRITCSDELRIQERCISMELSGGEQILFDCFLCEYSYEIQKKEHTFPHCRYCPLLNQKHIGQPCLENRHERFFHSLINEDFGNAARIAHEIANLPIVNREGEKYETND